MTAKDVYSWSRYTPIDKVKVIIIGQGGEFLFV